MLKARLLSTVAAAMLLSAGAVSAQTMKDQPPERAPAAQQNAPAEKTAPAIKHSGRKAHETTGQAAPKAAESDKAQVKGQPMDKDAKPAIKGSSDAKDSMKPESKNKNKAASGAASTKSSQSAAGRKKETTGQGAAAGSARLSSEQHSKIATIIRRHRVAPVHLNITVRVGARVPKNVHFYRLPHEVYVIYPRWRGYDYIMVGDQIIVLNPRTHEIVAILDA